MCHRSPLTVQGRAPLLLLLLFFFILSSLSLSLFFTPLPHSFSTRLLFPPPNIFLSLLSLCCCLSKSISLTRPLPPTPVIFHLPLSLHFAPSLSLFYRPSFMSLSSSIVLFRASALSPSLSSYLCHLLSQPLFISPPVFLPLAPSLFAVSGLCSPSFARWPRLKEHTDHHKKFKSPFAENLVKLHHFIIALDLRKMLVCC